MKKFLSMALALVMALSLCAGFATQEADAAFTDSDELSNAYAVQAADVIKVIEVMDGYDDGSFRPSAGLTRQAAAKIICNMVLGPTTAKALPTNANPFPDVLAGSQFSGYISYCSQQGIISGYSDGTFHPSDPLSGYAYLKMLLGALGYDANQEGFVGDNWKVNVAKIALGIGINKGMDDDFDGTTQVTREQAAVYAFNTLQADMVEYDSKNTIEINGVKIGMGGGNAKPQTWATSAAGAGKINDVDENGVSASNMGGIGVIGKDIVQFAERYFDKLERWPKTRDTYWPDDLGRPAIKWEWKGGEVGTYHEDADLVYYGNVKGNTIYNDLGMSSKDDAIAYFNGRPAGLVEISKGNSDDINKNNNVMKDKIGDGTIVEVYRNDANNWVTLCVINVWAGKVTTIKDATSSKNERIVLDIGKYNENDVKLAGNEDKRISKPLGIDGKDKNEYELSDEQQGTFAEDDIVAYTYAEQGSVNGANGIQDILYILSPVEGALTRRYADKSVVLDGTTYKFAKNIHFDMVNDEDALSTKSEYVAYLDDNDLVLWVEESEFSDDQYALVDRIWVENAQTNAVLSSILSANGQPNNNHESVSTSAPRAQLLLTSGSKRTVNLNESKAYRDDNALLTDPTGAPILDTNGNQQFGTVKAEFQAGSIIRYSTTSSGDYKLRSVPATNFAKFSQFDDNGNPTIDDAVSNNALRGFTVNGNNVQADSNTKFIVNDNGTYKTYTGIRNVPDIKRNDDGTPVVGYAYCKGTLAKVVYFTLCKTSSTSKDVIFLAAPSVSKMVNDDDYVPHFEYNAVVKNNVTTIRVAAYVGGASTSGVYNNDGTVNNAATLRVGFNNVLAGKDGKNQCTIINHATYDTDDVLTAGSFQNDKNDAYSCQGIKRVSGSVVDIKLYDKDNNNNKVELSKSFDDGVRVYFSNLDGEIEEIDVADIRTDGNDYVYYVEEGGEITYLFIQEVDEEDAPAQVTRILDGDLEQTDDNGFTYTLHVLSANSVVGTTVIDIKTWVENFSPYGNLNYVSSAGNVYKFDAGNNIELTITVQKDANRDVNGNEV